MKYFLTVYRNPDGSLQSGYLMANETIPKIEEGDFTAEADIDISPFHFAKMFPFAKEIPEGDLVELTIKPIKQICKTVTYTEKPFEGEI